MKIEFTWVIPSRYFPLEFAQCTKYDKNSAVHLELHCTLLAMRLVSFGEKWRKWKNNAITNVCKSGCMIAPLHI